MPIPFKGPLKTKTGVCNPALIQCQTVIVDTAQCKKIYNQKISPVCHYIYSVIRLFGLPVNAAECLIGYNGGVDNLQGFSSEIDDERNNL